MIPFPESSVSQRSHASAPSVATLAFAAALGIGFHRRLPYASKDSP